MIIILREFHWLYVILTLIIYLDSFLTSLFFFVFKSSLLIYYLGMINCTHLTCTIWWALTDVHTYEIPQNISIIFKKFLSEAFAIMPPPLLTLGSHCNLCHYGFPSSRSSYKCSCTICGPLHLVSASNDTLEIDHDVACVRSSLVLLSIIPLCEHIIYCISIHHLLMDACIVSSFWLLADKTNQLFLQCLWIQVIILADICYLSAFKILVLMDI